VQLSGLGVPVLALLALLGLAAGIGITALGPGGVLVTVGLFALTTLSPAGVAGTAIATQVGTGLVGSAAYLRSGQLAEPATRRIAFILCLSAGAGTPVGVWLNSLVSGRVFGVLLGVLVTLVAALLCYRECHPDGRIEDADPPQSVLMLASVGFVVAAASGVFGVGGPMLTVPLLIALGVSVLSALAAAQAQSVVIAGVGTIGYLFAGSISWSLAALVGVPELVGVLIGWKIAHSVSADRLKIALIVVLFALVPYLLLRG
jgi:uncharacterized protein